MDIDAQLPPNLEWYEDQIAGHHPSTVRNGVRQIGILKERGKKHIILKLVQPGNRGEREVAFYSRIKLAASQKQKNDVQKNSQNEDKNASLIVELAKFLPRFYGCRSIKLYEKDSPKEFLQLEDITYPFEKPCIMDIKIGKVTYDPDATEEKRIKEQSKCPFQEILGFRILGYRIHTETEFYSKDRVWGRERTLENLQQAFEEYLIQARPVQAPDILDRFIERLKSIQDWFLHQKMLHFYASSLLFVYEGHSQLPSIVDVRMIDFSHVFSVESKSQLDENYIHGLLKIIEIFQKIRNEYDQKNEN
uniref:Kinase n=1 Tax=Meloidogyne incognita TaxID=6306 RepID=A0A914KMH8_MELIC